jgi:hypothetical protein
MPVIADHGDHALVLEFVDTDESRVVPQGLVAKDENRLPLAALGASVAWRRADRVRGH